MACLSSIKGTSLESRTLDKRVYRFHRACTYTRPIPTNFVPTLRTWHKSFVTEPDISKPQKTRVDTNCFRETKETWRVWLNFANDLLQESYSVEDGLSSIDPDNSFLQRCFLRTQTGEKLSTRFVRSRFEKVSNIIDSLFS